jgi:hypothetical protein
LELGDELIQAIELGLEGLAEGVCGGERGQLLGEARFARLGLGEGCGGLVAGGLEVGLVLRATCGEYEWGDE